MSKTFTGQPEGKKYLPENTKKIKWKKKTRKKKHYGMPTLIHLNMIDFDTFKFQL